MKRPGVVSLPGVVALILTLLSLALVLPGTGPVSPADRDKPADKTRGAGPASGVGKQALLIGCTEYPNLAKSFWLTGPANDVELMRKLLMEKFGFPAQSITTLSDAEAKTNGEKSYPTRANIEREFKRLAEVARPGDKVVILMGGHGSQQPEDPNSKDPEPDGLDELFLPRDVGKWDGGNGKVPNAIIDDELGEWLEAIQKKKASVWIVIDACHSGTMIRDPEERMRQLLPVNDLGIPPEVIKAAEDRAAARDGNTRGGPVEENPSAKLSKQGGGIVAFYAAQSVEPTVERTLPPKAKDAKSYGLLSYTLCQTLIQASENGSPPLTYRELAKRVHSQYAAWDRTFPTPQIEGDDIDREVMGEKEWPGRSNISLSNEDKSLKINAGALRGLTPGTVLEVTPPLGQGNKVQGHVRIKEVRTLESDVEPYTYDPKLPARKDLPDGGSCKVVFVDYGDQRLRLSVAGDVPAKERQELLARLAAVGGKESLVAVVDKVSDADWLVRPDKDDKVWLFPVSGVAKVDGSENRLFRGPPREQELVPWLQEQLAKIARFESLTRLAAEPTTLGDFSPKLELTIKRVVNEGGRKRSIKVPWPSTKVTFYDGDMVSFEVTNTGRVPVDYTLLYLSSNYKIDCLFPSKKNEVNRLQPGTTDRLPPAVVGGTKGLEHLVMIGVRGSGERVDFRWLEQPAIAQARGMKGVGNSMGSPLGQLFQRALYAEGSTRGMAAVEADEHALSLYSWHIKAGKRPKEKE